MNHSGSVRHQVVRLVLAAALGGFVALVLLQLVPAAAHEIGPASVSARASIGPGRTDVVVPPLGTVSASTHASPLVFDVELSRVDFTELGAALNAGGPAALTGQLETGLRELARAILWRMLLGAAVLGALSGALLPRRRWPTVAAGTGGAVVVVGGCLLAAGLTFDVGAFEEPTFSGALVRAPQVLAAVDRSVTAYEELRSRYETGARRLSELLALVAEPNESPFEDSVAILHVSDIHSNPIGVEVARELARGFQVDAVVDTGDVTSFGEPTEARIGALIDRIDVPYLFVPGNHDSAANRAALERVANVRLLDDDVAEVNGVRILGWADPTFTASNETSTEEGNAIRAAEASEVAEAVAKEDPDVLAVHDARLAVKSVGSVAMVLAGHTHQQGVESTEGTTTLTVGSTGATGLGSFLAESDRPYEAEILYFRGGLAVAVDYVQFRGAGRDFEVERTTFEPEEEALPAIIRGTGRRARAAEGSALLMR